MSDGSIEAQGSYRGLKECKRDSLLSISPEILQSLQKENEKFLKLTEPASRPSIEKPTEEKEFQAIGSVDSRVYKEYFKSVGCVTLVIITVVLRILAQATASGVDYFVAQWVNWEESVTTRLVASNNLTDIYNGTHLRNTPTPPDVMEERQKYVNFYAILMIAFVVIIFKAAFLFFHICLRASKNLHDQMFRGVTGTYMAFFKNNPSGRILNRFSKDIGNIDSTLPITLFDCTVVGSKI